MKHLAAYLLLVAGGKANPSNEDIKKLLASVGIETDAARLDALLKSLEGKTIAEVIAEGTPKLASISAGPVAAAGGAAAAGAAAEEAPAEEKAEEKEESDDDMGFGLFD
ncbi:ribosomal protein 60S [Rhizopus microsporus var. microsporus]|uniref:Ribosomal protein 60S n=2 Tax=Rhizopus microsporus TaxID=58291 RepID=A0A2G4T246_RHIZD|nr:ribosomal protein 60S [Rhizopus microsporus ATCC 52813]ORE02063.1 ribosomal protein 60S [Rhizopus microsporus var. microsporus]PHZ15085.1 ribosomal protein 60S [Rhizopus microsporus ATCC 52813]